MQNGIAYWLKSLGCLIQVLCISAWANGQQKSDSMKVELQTLTVEERQLTALEKAIQLIGDSGLGLPVSLQHSTLQAGDFLQRSMPGIAIKNYGPSASSTLSVRGSSSNQTQMLWHGLNINQAWQSLSDLSLIPTGAFEQIRLQSDATCGIMAGITPGSSLLLIPADVSHQPNSLLLAYTIGSFGLHKIRTNLVYNRGIWTSQTSAQYFQANNNFPFQNIYKKDKPTENLSHASNRHFSLVHESGFRLNSKESIEVSIWILNNFRQLPPTMLMAQSAAEQQDQAYRGSLGWKTKHRRWTGQTRMAYFHDWLFYSDSVANLHETSRNQNLQAYTSWEYNTGKNMVIHAGAHTQWVQVYSEGYKAHKNQWNHALFGGFQLDFKRWHFDLSARQEWRKSKATPIGLGLTSIFKLRTFRIQLLANKVYRAASYNDLYWIPGGNPNLQAEKGYVTELGFFSHFKQKQWPQVALLLYSKWIQNWIQWLPTGTIWIPFNAKSVWAKGLEFRIKNQLEIRKWNLGIGAGLHLNQTQIRDASRAEENGKQLIYVPPVKLNTFFSLEWKNYFLGLDAVYNGKSFTSSDNKNTLPAWYTLNLTLVKTFPFTQQMEMQVSFSANNLSNVSYQTVEQRPMPGINFLGGIQLQFKHFKNK
ncbi:MAG: TonB-dependent receptor plug domain-containing protein [Bacteroidia bacterium]|nr:TonB-dependent receptor plug domain-containing protein [Bacteroidia bacterium]